MKAVPLRRPSPRSASDDASGRFQTDLGTEEGANLVVALIDGIGVPAALADPALPRAHGTTAGLVEDAMARLLGITRS